MQVIERLRDISDQFDALFCDVWGCVHNGVRPFEEAVRALAAFSSEGGAVLLLTNAPRPWRQVETQLAAIGVPRNSWDLIVTSGDAAKTALFQRRAGRRVFHIGPDRDLGFFDPDTGPQRAAGIEKTPIDEAEGIVCTGLYDDMTQTPEDYRGILRAAAARNLPFLCANPDIVVDRGAHRIYCAGALARLYGELGGPVLLFGKPRPDIYHLARTRLAEIKPEPVRDQRILCIGDGVATDIKGAERQQLPCLFVSGGLAAKETGTQRSSPDPVKLQEFCFSSGIRPDYDPLACSGDSAQCAENPFAGVLLARSGAQLQIAPIPRQS